MITYNKNNNISKLDLPNRNARSVHTSYHMKLEYIIHPVPVNDYGVQVFKEELKQI